MEKKENKNLQKRKRDKSLKKKKHKEIDSESLSEYESISEGSEDIVEEVEVEENENEINTNSKKEKDKNKEHVNLWDEQNLNKLKNNEVLDFDNNAYEMLHRSKVEWPCLSIDFLIPENFDKSNLKSFYSPNSERNLTEDKYPYTTYMIAGSQTNEKNGYLYYMKWYGMYKTKYDDDPDKGFDSDDEEAKNPYMKFEKVKMNGNINRIKSMKNSFISAIWTDYPSIEIIDISELISSINDQESISIEN
jgi:ribosome assembly protein RRB1